MGVIDTLCNLGLEVVTWIQKLGFPACAIAFGIGGLFHIFGGTKGVDKCKGWYIGAGSGFLVVLGAKAFAEFLQGRITF
ncbi:TPA: hypothetical protein ACG3PM_003073 [Clostridioides difficile]|uniref:hypothetical protein n=1 Tax=Clostridioides sp. ZZV14-6044 TaxID=2811488 RepID=UPI001C16DC83|nr:hypothetical protein [Clostridioides sp. ZZV14-6044]MCD8633449.1 hypothetical protein [Clostridioides difficile]MCI4874983.1 hypothetical protein [Clostridioides difficile]HBF3343021.1 hypothetical protein [Clostridioides difficile]HBF5866247.1 hypothetical protein [Clostridioides difficile]